MEARLVSETLYSLLHNISIAATYESLHHVVVNHIIAYQILTECVTLHHTTSHYITLHHITSHYITLHHTTSCHTTLHHITSHHTTSHHTTLLYTTQAEAAVAKAEAEARVMADPWTQEQQVNLPPSLPSPGSLRTIPFLISLSISTFPLPSSFLSSAPFLFLPPFPLYYYCLTTLSSSSLTLPLSSFLNCLLGLIFSLHCAPFMCFFLPIPHRSPLRQLS